MQQKIETLPIPPKAKFVPLVGSLPGLLRQKLEFLIDERERLGDIFRLDLGVLEFYIFAHPRHAQHILRDESRNYDKRNAIFDSFRMVGRTGLATTLDHEHWLRQRRMMQPHFNHKHLTTMMDEMIEEIDKSIMSMDHYADTGESFDITKFISKMTMNVLLRIMFGTALDDSDVDQMLEDVEFIFDFMLTATVTNSLPDWVPVPRRKRFQQALESVDEQIYKVVNRFRKDGVDGNNLLSMLVHMVDKETDHQMTDEQLRDETVTVFLGGFESTASGLEWLIYHLNENPEYKTRAVELIDRVVGTEKPNMSHLGELDYLQYAFKESMRIHSPAFWVPRRAVKEDAIDGFRIPENTTVVVMTHLIHHHPELWDNPSQYNPDRFSPENMAEKHNLVWMPFSAGQHQCIGRDLSLLEGQLILTRLLQHYTITPDPDFEVEAQVSTSLRTKGVQVTIERR